MANAHETKFRRWTTFTPPQRPAHAAHCGLVLHRRAYNILMIWASSGYTNLSQVYPASGYGINDNGQVAGEAGLSDNASHAFLWTNGVFTDLGTLGGTNSAARALNKVNQVVGDSDQNPNTAITPNRHAFLYTNGSMSDLNSLVGNISGWELQTAVGINDSGQIVGNGTYLGDMHGFLLTPITQVIASPTQGGNAGNVTVTLFYPGAMPTSVDLICGGTTIVGTSLAAIGPGAVQVTFNLTGAQPGSCNLVLNEPDGTSLTTSDAFSVVQGGAPKVWVDIVGFSKLRAGQPQQYFLLVGNSGSVDSPSGVTANLSFPSFLTYSVPDGQIAGSLFQIGTTSIVFYQFSSAIPAGTTLTLLVNLAAPTDASYAHQAFQIAAW